MLNCQIFVNCENIMKNLKSFIKTSHYLKTKYFRKKQCIRIISHFLRSIIVKKKIKIFTFTQ